MPWIDKDGQLKTKPAPGLCENSGCDNYGKRYRMKGKNICAKCLNPDSGYKEALEGKIHGFFRSNATNIYER